MPLGEVSEGLETPVQLIYLVALLGFVVVGAYLVVRQVLVRRELEEAAKVLGERIRTNDASPEDCFELGVILLRKKLYTQATKNLEKASRMWDGEPEELAQVHNALGFAYFNMDRSELALKNYKRAVELQPGYTTAWNNLGDAYEKARDWDQAMKAYEETLTYSPDNKVAQSRVNSLRNKVSMAR
ncbi:g2218 [Coccomyxa viridis]|uniref:G2218 protein n=1 Tax=Coccomyxa viridis TaxID=1274662 RepID=A0ABP1FJU5_9CHLO